jgi:hypothetical protein
MHPLSPASVNSAMVGGKKKMPTFGSRAQVFHGNAKKTTGGLMKKDLLKNKWGEIVSLKKHRTAKKERRLEKHGWTAKKGKFGAVRTKTKRKSRYGRK